MNLTFRPTRPADFDQCLTLIQDGFLYGAEARRNLVRLWTEVLGQQRGESAVIEDEDRPRGARVVGIGLSVFVTDEFVEEARTTLPPYIGLQVLDRWAGGRCPILRFEDVARANAGEGINVLALHGGWLEEGVSAEEVAQIRHLLLESFIVHHRGYQLKTFLQEVYGEFGVQFMQTIGAHVWTDYGWYYAQASAPPDCRPYLMGMTRAEALKQEGTMAFSAFFPSVSRFHFTPREQDVLRHALEGKTDEVIAAQLGIAAVTVKKRWEAIYSRVMAVDRELLTPRAGDVAEAGRRGVEKRRLVLQYLRHHPEELRPGGPPRPGGRRT
jgi:DNA-binding CsgD family transcriptional regulator